MNQPVSTLIAIDPGRSKCGVAVVKKCGEADTAGHIEILYKSVVASSDIGAITAGLARDFSPDIIIIGNGTNSAWTAKAIEDLHVAHIELVDEKDTSWLARKRYFIENPPRGLWRLIPTSLQTPPTAYDDYVAILLAERYLNF